MVVEQLREHLAAIGILEDPAVELLDQFGLLVVGRLRFRLVERGRFAPAALVVNRNPLAVEHQLEQFRCRDALRAPLLGGVGRGRVSPDLEGVGQARESHLPLLAQQVGDEVGIDLGRDPGGAQLRRDLVRTPGLGLDRLQRLDVAGQLRLARGVELAAHVARQILVLLGQLVGFRVHVSQRCVTAGQFLGSLVGRDAAQLGHALDVDAAELAQHDGHRVGHALGAVLPRRGDRHRPVQDGVGLRAGRRRLDAQALGPVHRHRWSVLELERQDQALVRHFGNDAGVGLVVQVAVRLDVGLVGLAQLGTVVLHDLGLGVVRLQVDLLDVELADLHQFLEFGQAVGAQQHRRGDVGDRLVDLAHHHVAVLDLDLLALLVELGHFLEPLALHVHGQGVGPRAVLGQHLLGDDRAAGVGDPFDDFHQVPGLVVVDAPDFAARGHDRQRLAQRAMQFVGAVLLLLGLALDLHRRQGLQERGELGRQFGRRQLHVQVVLVLHGSGPVHDPGDHAGVVDEILADLHRLAAQRVLDLAGLRPAQFAFQVGLIGLALAALLRTVPRVGLGAAGVHGAHHPAGVSRRAFAQEQDVGHHRRVGVALECRAWQAHGAQQFGLHGDRLAAVLRAGIHQVARHHHDLQASGLERVQAGQEELVVDALAVELGVVLEPQAVAAERRVADGQVERVFGQGQLLDARGDDGGLRVQGARDARRDAVQFDAGHASGSAQGLGQQADEVAGSDRRLQGQAAGKAHALDGAPHEVDHRGTGVVRVLGRGAGRVQLLGRQEGLDLLHPLQPVLAVLARHPVAEGVGQAAPAHVAREHALLGRGGAPVLGLDQLEGLDGRDVVAVLGRLATAAQLDVGVDREVGCRDPGRRYLVRRSWSSCSITSRR